MPYEFMKPFSF